MATLIDPTKKPKPLPPKKIITQKVVQIAPKPLTWQDNPQNCDENLFWIASEAPFFCIAKTTIESQNPAKTADYGSNEYPSNPYQCTRYAKDRRPDIPNHLGDARYWYDELADMGWSVGYEPKAGAIGQSIYGNHVIYVEYVVGDQIYLSERNWDYNGGYRERLSPASDFKYIY